MTDTLPVSNKALVKCIVVRKLL